MDLQEVGWKMCGLDYYGSQQRQVLGANECGNVVMNRLLP